MTPNPNFDEIKKQAQSEGKVLADFEAREALIAQNAPDRRRDFALNSAAQNWSRQSFLEHKTDLSRINYDSLNDEQKRLYDALDALNRESERIAYEDKKNQTIRGVSALIQKGEEISDAEAEAGVMAWANLTGLYQNMPVEQIAEAWNVSDKRKLWLEVLRPAFISLSSSPKTRLELLAMGEKKRRQQFDEYWKEKNFYAEKTFINATKFFAPAMGTAGGAAVMPHNLKNKPEDIEPKIPEPTEQDYQDWIAEKTFGLQRLQLEYLLQSNMRPDVAALAWKVALSDMLSTEEKAKIIENSHLSQKEQSQVINAAYAMNSELDYGLLWQSLSKSGDALSDFASNVWDFSTDTLPKLALDLLSELGIREQSPVDLYEKVEEAGGLEDFFEKNEIRSGLKMINIEKIYELGKTQAEARKLRRQLENADANRYKSLGFVKDGISDGVAVFARMTPVFATRLIPGGAVVSEVRIRPASARGASAGRGGD